MTRTIFCGVFLAALLVACSKQGQSQPAPPPPAPAARPPQLTITNTPVSRPPSANVVTNNPLIEKGIEVRGAGNLFIKFPRTWEDKLARIPANGLMIDTIIFRPRTNAQFEMMVDVNNIGQAAADRISIKEALQQAGQGALTNAIEKSLEIREFQGGHVTGCYFVVTDRNYSLDHPAKGDFRYLTQGYAKLGGLILSFHLVCNDLSPEQGQMLEMLKTARLEKKATGTQSP